MKQTEKKIALITGGNRGLGYEIARQLGEKEMVILVCSRGEAAGKAAVAQLNSQNIEAHFIQLDILEPESIVKAVHVVE